MKILIIDDDDYKIKKISECLNDHFVETAKSYNTGMRKLLQNDYDALILDMNFPTFDSDSRIIKEQGLFVLSELRRKKRILPVLVYSSGLADVSEYDFVKKYIVADNTYIRDRLQEFIADLN